MDNLTHGLFGLAIGALRRPDRKRNRECSTAEGDARLSPTDRAVLVCCVVAAELPDLDTFWPSGNDVLQALHAHRGPTHALLFAPLVALVAVLLVRPLFRGADARTMFAWALPSTLLAHLLADAWTGWGTRLFLPFSDRRLSLDWTLVVDPLVTVPLLLGAAVALVLALRQRARNGWRTAILCGFALSAAYVGARVAARAELIERLGRDYPAASRVEVFPLPFDPITWRYAVQVNERYRVGVIRPFGARTEQAVHVAAQTALPEGAADEPTVREALAWARLPIVTTTRRAEADGGGYSVRIADLRYHFGGAPTLAFHFELAPDGTMKSARFDRGGSARELLRRLRDQ